MLVLALSLVAASAAIAGVPEHGSGFDEVDGPADHGQHGDEGGHLPGSRSNVDLVGRVDVSGAVGLDKPGHIADVAAKGNYAYLAARRPNGCGVGGFYTIDISDPRNPTEVSFTAFPTGSFPGEGMQVVRISTPFFRGDILATNNENCGSSPDRVGGMSLYDVTDPLNIEPLAIGKGDLTVHPPRANQIHSIFAWQGADDRAFAVVVDNEEIADVDIFEITDPRNPVMVSESSILDWPDAHAPLANGESVFFHDVVVKRIRGQFYMLLSYWDAGWIILDVDDPANPVFVDDSDYPDPEPLLGFSPPEGNAHQAEWSHDNRFIVGTDEDFSPSRLKFEITTGPNAGLFGGGQFSWTVPIDEKYEGGVLHGPTIWGGSGCTEDTNGNSISDRDEVPPASSLPADPGEAKSVVFSRGTCFFSTKVESGQLAGYDNVIIGQSHAGTRNGLTPNGFTCGGQGHTFTITASSICIGHRAMHLLFNDEPEYTPAEGVGGFTIGADLPPIGTVGEKIRAETTFDGWGTVHLLDAETLAEIDNFSISEAIDPAFASGFGTLSVHEVANDPMRNLGYLSWYDAGLRVVRYGMHGMKEVGHYIDEGGNDFWGVQAHRLPGQRRRAPTLILASDRDSGLWIFRYTGSS